MMEIQLRMMDAQIVRLIQDISATKNCYKHLFVINVKKIALNVLILTPKLIAYNVI